MADGVGFSARVPASRSKSKAKAPSRRKAQALRMASRLVPRDSKDIRRIESSNFISDPADPKAIFVGEQRKLAQTIRPSIARGAPMDEHAQQLILAGDMAAKSRLGYCDDCAGAICSQLIRDPAFPLRVEMFGLDPPKHAWVVVGRDPASNIEDPSTWGDDAFIIDTWSFAEFGGGQTIFENVMEHGDTANPSGSNRDMGSSGISNAKLICIKSWEPDSYARTARWHRDVVQPALAKYDPTQLFRHSQQISAQIKAKQGPTTTEPDLMDQLLSASSAPSSHHVPKADTKYPEPDIDMSHFFSTSNSADEVRQKTDSDESRSASKKTDVPSRPSDPTVKPKAKVAKPKASTDPATSAARADAATADLSLDNILKFLGNDES